MSSEADLCIRCGILLPNAVVHGQFGLIPFTQRQMLCGPCAFADYFRRFTLVQRCPYKARVLRPMLTGQPPLEWLRRFEQTRKELFDGPEST